MSLVCFDPSNVTVKPQSFFIIVKLSFVQSFFLESVNNTFVRCW